MGKVRRRKVKPPKQPHIRTLQRANVKGRWPSVIINRVRYSKELMANRNEFVARNGARIRALFRELRARGINTSNADFLAHFEQAIINRLCRLDIYSKLVARAALIKALRRRYKGKKVLPYDEVLEFERKWEIKPWGWITHIIDPKSKRIIPLIIHIDTNGILNYSFLKEEV